MKICLEPFFNVSGSLSISVPDRIMLTVAVVPDPPLLPVYTAMWYVEPYGYCCGDKTVGNPYNKNKFNYKIVHYARKDTKNFVA